VPDTTFEGMDELSQTYLRYCIQQGEPANTLAARRRVLTNVATAATATREELEDWYAERAYLSPATRNADLSLLRSFYKWADLFEHRLDDPTRRLKGPKMPSGLPRPFSRAECDAVFEYVREQPDLLRASALGAYGGTRIEEAVALNWPEIDLETNRMRVTGKGNKTRMVGLSPLLYDIIGPALTGGENVVTGTKLELTERDLEKRVNTFQKRMNRAIHAAGVEGTYHCFRHRYVTVALAATGDLLGVSRAVGHASLNTTSRYAQLADESLDLIAAAVTR